MKESEVLCVCSFKLRSSYSTDMRLLVKYIHCALSISSTRVNSSQVPELAVWMGGRVNGVDLWKEKAAQDCELRLAVIIVSLINF